MSLKLYIQPKTILFQARVNEPSAVTYPRDYVDFDTVTNGTYSIIGLNQTVLIGTSAGAHDLGITRVRKAATSSRIYIGRSSKGDRIGEVTLTDNAYITVLKEVRVFPKIPYIDSNGVTYFDSDLAWADWGQNSPPVANAGSAVVGTIDSGTSKLTVNFSAANSFVTMPGASIASYTWNVNGGTITVGTSADQDITATFDAGFYLVSLLVADDNAEFHYCYVPVLAIDPASDPCIYNFEIESHRITPDGQELQLRIREDIDAATYLDGAWCALIDGDPGDADDRTNIVFQGWIEISDEEIAAQETGLLRDVSLTALDVAGRLKRLPGFSTVIEHAASPANWQEMTTPDMGRFLHYLLQWQSTALDVADFTLYGDEDDYTFRILASDGATIWDQVQRRAGAMIPDHMATCNRLGQLAIGVDPLLQDSADRTSSVQTTLTAALYSNLRYRQERNPRIHWLRSNAIIAGTSSPIATAFCIAPGDAPGFGAQSLDDGEHLALSQSDLNATTGHRYARANAPQGLFTFVLAEGNDYGLEPAALTWLQATIDSTAAAQRGLTFTEARFLMKQIDIRYRHAATGLTKTITIQAERETEGLPATTVAVEAADPVDDGGWVPGTPDAGDMFNNGLVPGVQNLAFIDASGVIYTTSDFQSGSPTWSRNTSAAAAVSIGAGDVQSWVVDPFSPKFRGTGTEVNGWICDRDNIYRLEDVFGTPAYTSVFTFANTVNRIQGEMGSINASFGRYQVAESDNPWLICARSHRSTSDQNGVYVVYSVDGGQTWSSEIAVTSFNDTAISNSPRRVVGLWLSPRTPGYAILAAYTADGSPTSADLYVTTDWGASWSAASFTADPDEGLAYSVHVPWHDNADESLVYYGSFNRDSNFVWGTRRTDGTTDSDISPSNAGIDYGPIRSNFGIMSLDTNRLRMVMCGEADGSGTIDIDQSSTSAVGGAFVSDDGGDTWTMIIGPNTGGPNVKWPLGAAFASGDGDELYVWGNEYIGHSTDGGATVVDKSPGSPIATSQEVIGITGDGS